MIIGTEKICNCC